LVVRVEVWRVEKVATLPVRVDGTVSVLSTAVDPRRVEKMPSVAWRLERKEVLPISVVNRREETVACAP
jgi:hypothetical protein